MEHLIVETPEQVVIEFPLAGIGSRSLALALDTLIQLVIGLTLFLLWVAAGALGMGHWSPLGSQPILAHFRSVFTSSDSAARRSMSPSP